MIKKLGIGCLSIIGILAIVGIGLYIANNENLPEGKVGPEADAMAQNLLKTLDKPAWDSLGYISWTFSGRNHYAWDKQNNIAQIKSGASTVVLNLDDIEGKAFENGTELTGEVKAKAIQKAWGNWCNDSFWLYAPYKVFDPNTTRSIVEREDGTRDLLISYQGGGVTPGDAYLWQLDGNGLPQAYKMWVKIIPIGGMKSTWEDWTTLPGGAKVAQKHMLGPMNVSITNLKAGQQISDLGIDANTFSL